jgi:SAM-dependent methyltransferase
MFMRDFIAAQFRRPDGIIGAVVSRIMERSNMPSYLALFRRMPVPEGAWVCEIGYGPGKGLELLLATTDCRASGIDFSSLMHRRASRRNRRFIREGRLTLFCGDINAEVVTQATYDIVFFVNVIYFWGDLVHSFTRIRDLLKPGGRVYFYMSEKEDLEKFSFTLSDQFNRYRSPDVRDIMLRCGFDSVEVHRDTSAFSRGCYFSASTRE